jgi:uncharacterized protein (DUF1778 family)
VNAAFGLRSAHGRVLKQPPGLRQHPTQELVAATSCRTTWAGTLPNDKAGRADIARKSKRVGMGQNMRLPSVFRRAPPSVVIPTKPNLTRVDLATTLPVDTESALYYIVRTHRSLSMPVHAALAYLELPADDRLETRLPKVLKRHAETVAKAKGETLSEYVVEVLAERVAAEIGSIQEWRLTATEQAELLRILSGSTPTTAALEAATRRAERLFGV